MTATQYHTLPDGRTIAYRFIAGSGPAIVFLPGYMSDMAGGKATAVFDWAAANGCPCLLLDYSGCGESAGNDMGGDFADGTLSRWRDEVLALIEAKVDGPVILIGSSMGGWLMLMVALALPPEKRAGLIGIAPAPDFTEWGRSPEDKAKLRAGEVIYEPNQYGPEPTPTYPGFWADGEANKLLDSEIPIDCPVRLLHGQADPDVPWDISLRLASALRSGDVRTTFIKHGDHRLSRDGDIALLVATVAEMAKP